ncbi:hypothetical protein [uncultured Flavobacterium sp.]|uniref:hypothetical protein n=1 Tax=uncultured Flavobacterium sp. TaxID=165435 RepID=UPI0030EC247F|tara:strand:- start:57512 stop:57925 length:414 start_codon:yes stop_codon:yes gene_type:complete
MKTIFKLLLLFIISASCFGQKPSKSLYFMSFSNENRAFQKPVIDFKKFDFNASSFDLQIYNPSIGLFENYNYVAENQFERSDKMILNYTRNQPLNWNSTPLLNSLTRRYIDSFNPYGVSNIGEAFALGVINTILNKN